MEHAAPSLPTRFPCWCRATYSWGGESKRDLGFVEGDLIECLNAGDGSWWMGRLRRDKRAMGLFPSNFVQVLDASFQPVSRVSNPMPAGAAGSITKPSPQKSKTFRKPFQAYARAGSPNPAAAAANAASINNGSTAPSPVPSRQSSSLQSPSKTPSRHPSYLQDHSSPSRQPSYLKTPESPTGPSRYRQTSSTPTRQLGYLHQSSRPSSSSHNSAYASRVPSPAPPAHYQPSPEHDVHNDDDELKSSPPPPPPPHRVAYTIPPPRASPSPTPSMNDRYPTVSRGPSPAPPSPGVHGHTPSPLRDAMDDVMSSLHDMAMRRNDPSPSPEQEPAPLDPWSPEAFEELRVNPNTQKYRRPRSSLGIAPSQRGTESFQNDNGYGIGNYKESPPEVCDYVERMEDRLRSMGANSPRPPDELFLPDDPTGPPPAPPPKNSPYQPRTQSSLGMRESVSGSTKSNHRLKNRKSAYELGRSMLDRTFTTKSSATSSSSGVQSLATNGTTSTQRTSQSLMSGYSAGGFSATSAGSLARRKWGSISKSKPLGVVDNRQDALLGLNGGGSTTRPQTPSHYSSNQSRPGSSAGLNYPGSAVDSGDMLGGLTTPKSRKSGFFKKLVESAKTGAASARSSIATGQTNAPRSPIKTMLPNGVTAIAGGSAARDKGVAGGKTEIDWVQVRRDVNRSNSLSRNERSERIEICQMMDYPVVVPVQSLLEAAEGDEGADGMPIQYPTDFHAVNLQLVDKSARFVNSLPPMTNSASLTQGYVCRPYRSDVQRLRAIFTWVSEKVAWEEDFEGEVDSRRVIQMRRGCSEEVAVLVSEMCSSVGLHAEIVRGYLKSPGEPIECESRPNHWWNAVIVDDCWRIMDCSLASPTNPRRGRYSSAGSQVAENGFFLARPMEICYTHIPSNFEQQHICPPIAPDVLLALPCACPPYFRNNIQMVDYDTSLLRIENLELVHIQLTVPADIECVAEVESSSYARDADGDVFESGETTTNRALAQAEWVKGQKRYTVKALLPGDSGHGTLKVYAGKRGLMHSIKGNPYPLAFALPIVHTGINPPYDFLLRHPTPHAQRHDLYVAQPQCARLAINNTFVFAVRQHPSFVSCTAPEARSASPSPFARPSSAMSMMSTATSANDYFSQAGSNSSDSSQQQKPAKLAIQAPSGKILRLMRKSENSVSIDEAADGGVWETIIKIGERGTWRGLVLADRSARWCVFGEWEAV